MCAQHNTSLKNVNDIILEALASAGDNVSDNAVHSEGVIDNGVDLEDEDYLHKTLSPLVNNCCHVLINLPLFLSLILL